VKPSVVDGICISAYTGVIVESLGTIGHPDGCAAACKYAKRKGRCNNGSSCTKCHLCNWSRKDFSADALQDPAGLDDAISPVFTRSAQKHLQHLIHLELDIVRNPYSTANSGAFGVIHGQGLQCGEDVMTTSVPRERPQGAEDL
jgi:hypothetical protein